MSDGGGSTTSKEAAIKIILGEMGPLLDKADSAAKTLKEAHGFIEEDLLEFGKLVRTLEESLSQTMDHVTYVLDQAKAARTVAAVTPAASRNEKAGVSSNTKQLVFLMFGCSVLSAALAVGAGAALAPRSAEPNPLLLEQAKIGRAVTSALPYIDAATKQKLEAAMQKASSK